jgi:hypothetical protein
VDLIDSISNDAGKRDRRQILPRKRKTRHNRPGLIHKNIQKI